MSFCLQGSFELPKELTDSVIYFFEDRHSYTAPSPPMSIALSVSARGQHSMKLQFFLNVAAFEDSPSGALMAPIQSADQGCSGVNMSCSLPCLLPACTISVFWKS